MWGCCRPPTHLPSWFTTFKQFICWEKMGVWIPNYENCGLIKIMQTPLLQCIILFFYHALDLILSWAHNAHKMLVEVFVNMSIYDSLCYCCSSIIAHLFSSRHCSNEQLVLFELSLGIEFSSAYFSSKYFWQKFWHITKLDV